MYVLLAKLAFAVTVPALTPAPSFHSGGSLVAARLLLPSPAVPGVQELARTGDQLLGGVLIVEAVFAIPGTATALIEAVQSRDVPTVQALTLLLAAVALAFNVAADLVCQRLAPRSEVLR